MKISKKCNHRENICGRRRRRNIGLQCLAFANMLFFTLHFKYLMKYKPLWWYFKSHILLFISTHFENLLYISIKSNTSTIKRHSLNYVTWICLKVCTKNSWLSNFWIKMRLTVCEKKITSTVSRAMFSTGQALGREQHRIRTWVIYKMPCLLKRLYL